MFSPASSFFLSLSLINFSYLLLMYLCRVCGFKVFSNVVKSVSFALLDDTFTQYNSFVYLWGKISCLLSNFHTQPVLILFLFYCFAKSRRKL